MASTPDNNVSQPSQRLINAFRTDLFGRTKISEPYTIFDSQHRYQINGDFDYTVESGGSVSYNSNESAVFHNVGTASGSEVTAETFRVFPYQPGKSLQVMQTFVFSPPQENLRQRVGYFGRRNGFYLEQDGSNIYFVRRTASSGFVVETRVPQSEWNVDKLDGTGPSDVVLDLSKAQILFSEFEWLGVGSVRLGFAIDGYFIIAHQFNHANYIETTYMTTAVLPCRMEITNTGETAQESVQKQICTTVISNGGYFRPQRQNYEHRVNESVGAAYEPMIAIRLASGREDSVIIPEIIDLFPNSTDNFEFALVKNPVLSGGTWNLYGPRNNVEVNNTATSMSSGEIVQEGFFGSGVFSTTGVTISDNKNFTYQLGRTNSDTPVSDVYVLAVRCLTGTGSVRAAMSWADLL